MVVHTVGHSTLALDDFLALLAAHGIVGIVDVRRYPASRRHPHFTRDALARALTDAGIAYDWVPELGGRRSTRADSPHVAWRNVSFRGYADHMETGEFRAGIGRLLDLARARPTAIMCAEAVPWRCHRQLIADALVAGGVIVRHVLGPRATSEHALTAFARVAGERVVYDRGQLDLDTASGVRRDRR